jgi:hypothetical protein
VLFARLMSGYGRDASLNAKERKAPGTVSITQLPGSPTASRCSMFGSEAVEGEEQRDMQDKLSSSSKTVSSAWPVSSVSLVVDQQLTCC